MTSPDRPLDSLMMSIPRVWEMEAEWREALEDADPLDKPLQKLKHGMAQLLEPVQDLPPSPELLAWLMLWTRTSQSLLGLQGAASTRSLLTVKLLARTAFEDNVHLGIIMRPINPKTRGPSDRMNRLASIERMRAYFAWCVWNDLQRWRDFLDPKNLDWVFEAGSTRRYVQEFGSFLQVMAPWLGELPETLTDAEAHQERKEAEEVGARRVTLLESWLSDDRVRDWAEELETREIWQFSALVNENENTIKKALKGIGHKSSYGVYRDASKITHGASVEGTLFLVPPAIGPTISPSEDEVTEAVDSALTWVRQCFLALMVLNPGAPVG